MVQVNPSSSGGRWFNLTYGLVMGQVSLKATIEGAGFATPGDQVAGFLVRNADLSVGLKLRREWMASSGTRRIDATLEEVSDDAIIPASQADSNRDAWAHSIPRLFANM